MIRVGFLEQRECWGGKEEVGEILALHWIDIPNFPWEFLSFSLEQKHPLSKIHPYSHFSLGIPGTKANSHIPGLTLGVCLLLQFFFFPECLPWKSLWNGRKENVEWLDSGANKRVYSWCQLMKFKKGRRAGLESYRE